LNQFALTFHHLGLAVREPSRARAFLHGLGYRIDSPVFDPEQNVNLAMAWHEQMPAVEIIWSDDVAGPVGRIVEKHAKGLVYHVCYVSESIAASFQALAEAGLTPFCVSRPKRAMLFGGRLVSFYTVKGIGLIEIIEGIPSELTADPALSAAKSG
jgi:hypothetical protein